MTSFLRAVGRAVGWDSSEHTDSPEFVAKLANFKAHMDDVQRVRDAMQLYSDALETMMAAQVVLGEAMDGYYKSSSKVMPPEARANPPMCHTVAHAFKKNMMEMYGYVRPAVHEVFVSRCVRPVTYILSRAPAIHDQITQRKKMISSFHDVHSNIQGYKNSTNTAALAREESRLNAITLELGRLDAAITSTLDDFAESRPNMLAQELASVVACTYHQSQTNSMYLSALLPLLPQAASSLCLLQAACATRAKKLNDQSDDQPVQDLLSKFISGDIDAAAVTLERNKASGGRTGGYGLVTRTSSNSRRRSLKRVQSVSAVPTIQPDTTVTDIASAAGQNAAAILSGKSLAAAELIDLGEDSSSDESSNSSHRGSDSARISGSGGADQQYQQDSSLLDGPRPPKPPRERSSSSPVFVSTAVPPGAAPPGSNRGGVRISSTGGAFVDPVPSAGMSN